jgi:hypothetical protein
MRMASGLGGVEGGSRIVKNVWMQAEYRQMIDEGLELYIAKKVTRESRRDGGVRRTSEQHARATSTCQKK